MILYRSKRDNYDDHLISYDDLIDIETLKHIIK